MKNFEITFNETLCGSTTVSANTEEEAKAKAYEMWANGEVSADGRMDYEFVEAKEVSGKKKSGSTIDKTKAVRKKYQLSVTEIFIGYIDCVAESKQHAVRMAETAYRNQLVDFGHHKVEFSVDGESV